LIGDGRINMNPRFMTYLVAMIILSVLTGLYEWFIIISAEAILLIASIIFFGIHIIFRELYSNILGVKLKNLVTNGLVFSSVIGASLLILKVFSVSNFNGGVNEWNSLYVEINVAIIIIYLISIVVCFLIDSFFNKETKHLKKSRIALASVLFYTLNYVMSYFIAILTSVTLMFSKWA